MQWCNRLSSSGKSRGAKRGLMDEVCDRSGVTAAGLPDDFKDAVADLVGETMIAFLMTSLVSGCSSDQKSPGYPIHKVSVQARM